MKNLKSAKHHWWPRCVSEHWTGADGKAGWLSPDGSVKRVPPAQLGMIGNGHMIKLSEDLSESTPWDQNFEAEFDDADGNFPAVISWLEGLTRAEVPGSDLRPRFVPQPATDEQLLLLTECMVSLVVRSPRNREASVSIAENIRGSLPSAQRNSLIGLNMRLSQRIIADNIGARAKFAVLFSQGKEFIFGDGFFHNLLAVNNPPHSPKMLVPVTPNISVVINRPSSWMVEPRLSSLVLTDEEVDRCNHAVQAYSRNAIFFRTEQPTIDDAFASGKHLVYEHPDNPIDSLLRSLPGVPPRNPSYDLFRRAKKV